VKDAVRQIGTMPKELDPQILADYLLALGTTTKINEQADGWAVWVHNEDHVGPAKQELESFLKDPNDPRYHEARRVAAAARREKQEAEKKYRKNFKDMTGYWDGPAPLRRRPVTVGLIAVSVVVYLVVHLSGWDLENLLLLSSVSYDRNGMPSLTGLDDIRHGELWRLVTPIFLHFGILHLLFNMWCLQDLGALIELRLGTRELGLLVLVAAVTSNAGEYLWQASHLKHGQGVVPFGGMSGVVFALLGYAWMRGNRQPELGITLHPMTINMMLLWLVICMTGTLGPIANAAHVVGLIVGVLVGLARV
jgi:GlpG protein